MSSIATYSFLPYLRQGLANNVKNTGGARGIYTVKLKVESDNGSNLSLAPRDVELYGPGDVVGIDPNGIVKTEPRSFITNFEPNYLAHIEFYEEDFPWRYTPMAPEASHRLKPWIVLVLLKEGEFKNGQNLLDRPSPYITLKDVTPDQVFPNEDQSWAWAHVHVNQDIVGKTIEDTAGGMEPVLNKLQDILNKNADLAYSRLVCPRKLEADTNYHAFVLPAFESGRLAGVGADQAQINAAGVKLSWDAPTNMEYPVYFRWEFKTGAEGDFEQLVRLLVPKPADLRVGRRDMDMTQPKANLEWVEAPDFDLEGILRLGGALQVPRKTLPAPEREKLEKLDNWAKDRFPHPFQTQLAALLNLADDYQVKETQPANTDAGDAGVVFFEENDPDPIITPPIYGRWHAMVERVLQDRDGNPIHHDYNWLNELNLDPRYRVPAHFGTRVVQTNQENYMNAAWEQVGEVIKANQQIRYAQIAEAASAVLYQKYLVATQEKNAAQALLLTAPLQKRIMYEGSTVFQQFRESLAPNAVLSEPMRRILRPRGRFVKDLQAKSPAGTVFKPEVLVEKMNSGEVLAAPPKVIAPGLPSAEGLSEALKPNNLPPWLVNLLGQYPWLPWVPLGLALLVALFLLLTGLGLASGSLGLAICVGLVYLSILLFRWRKQLRAADGVKQENQTPEAVAALPSSPDFRLSELGENFQPRLGGGADNEAARRFKESLGDSFRLVQLTDRAVEPPKPLRTLPIAAVGATMVNRLDPGVTIPKWTWERIRIPDWIRNQMPQEEFVEAMAYPRFDLPMYKPLVDISAELFLPNINLIEYNSITLLETNQKFIEAYMVGLNHEFARELLWREYPTDQRGSYFRQFWDASTLLNTTDTNHEGKTEEEIRELYRDIPKLHRWSKFSNLGDHDHRQKPGEVPEEEVVLVIRGELLKKYPNAVVYAHKAVWENKSDTDPTFDKTKARDLYKPDEGDKSKPDFKVIRTPLYEARVSPDITFFGFKLGVDEAKGDSDPQTPTLDNAGWFFVIKERPGEPRFGFDIPKADVDAQPNITWNDISWSEVLPGVDFEVPQPNPIIVNVNPNPAVAIKHPIPAGTQKPDGLEEQHNEDIQIHWNTAGKQVDAADLAYIMYQVPVLVAVHAAEMLPKT